MCPGFARWNYNKLLGSTCIPIRQIHWVGLGQRLNHAFTELQARVSCVQIVFWFERNTKNE